MRRRDLLIGLTGGAAVIAGSGTLTFRLHRQPNRAPFLSETHLTTLMSTELPVPRVLFVGNSMVLNHDLPKLVSGLASEDGIELGVATAAANGARLIETLRIGSFRKLLSDVPWSAVVLQDFTKTPLRATDRLGSSLAIRQIASALQETPIVLYPPFPASSGNSVYASAGKLTVTPKDPTDYARRTMAHYSGISIRQRSYLAPVPEKWLETAGPQFYAPDGHHPSRSGSEFIASILWPVIKTALSERL